jgi:hypothetical protein
MAKARSAAAKHRADAARELAKITPRISESMARTHRRNAASAERKAVAEDATVTTTSTIWDASPGISRPLKPTSAEGQRHPLDARRISARRISGHRPGRRPPAPV